MLTVTKDNVKTDQDVEIYNQTVKKVEQMHAQTVEWFFAINQENTHDGYAFYGRGGSHVFISRKADGERILMVTEK